MGKVLISDTLREVIIPEKAWLEGRPSFADVLRSSATSACRRAFSVLSSAQRVCSSWGMPLHCAKGEAVTAAGA